ncbi:MAG: DVUA0089 family protein [Bacteroidota bacterium]
MNDFKTASSTVAVTVTPVNDAPVATNDSYTTAEDTPLVVAAKGLLVNDHDVDGDVLTSVLVSGPSHGSLTLNGDGSFTYTPVANYNGSDSFTYRANDGTVNSATAATVSITVTAVNDLPVANPDLGSMTEDAPATAFTVLANDILDPDLGASNAVAIGQPATFMGSSLHYEYIFPTPGSVNYSGSGRTVTVDGNVEVQTNPTGEGGNYFTVDISGNQIVLQNILGNSVHWSNAAFNGIHIADVSNNLGAITGVTVSDPALAGRVTFDGNDIYLNWAGYTLTTSRPVVLDVTFANSATVSVDAPAGVDITAADVAVSVNGANQIVVDPGEAFNHLAEGEQAIVHVPYQLTGNAGDVATSELTVTVTGVNDAPLANNLSATFTEDTGGSLNASYSDVDTTDSHVITVDTTGTRGLVTNNNGTFTYNPNGKFEALGAGQTATDTFTYTVNDGHGGVVTRQAVITITGVNDAPVAVGDSGAAQEAGGIANGTAGSDATGNVLANDSDVDAGDSITVSAVTSQGSEQAGTVGTALHGAYGWLTLNANGDYTYAVDNDNAAVQALQQGSSLADSFTYTVRDVAGATTTARLTVSIAGQNDNPVGQDDHIDITEDSTPVAIDVLANDHDVDQGTVLTLVDIDTTGTLGNVTSSSGQAGLVPREAFGVSNNPDLGDTTLPSVEIHARHDSASDVDWYVFTVQQGERLILDIDHAMRPGNPDSVDTMLWVYDANGNQIAANDDGGTASGGGGSVHGYDSYIATGPLSAGTYRVAVTAYYQNPLDPEGSSGYDGGTYVLNASIAPTESSTGFGTVPTVLVATEAATVTYDPTDAFQSLGAGETATDTFTYRVADQQGAMDTRTVTVTIHGVNDAPEANGSVDSQTVIAGNQYELQLPANLFKDIDRNDTLTLSAKLANGDPLPTWLTFDAKTQRFTGIANNSDVGTLSVEITATDTSGATAKITYEVKVVANNNLALSGTSTTGTGDGQTGGTAGTAYNAVNPGRTSGNLGDTGVPDPTGVGTSTGPGRVFDPNALISQNPTAAGPQDQDTSPAERFELASVDFNGQRDDFVIFAPPGVKMTFELPKSLTEGSAAPTFVAVQMNGDELPNWLSFDPLTGKFLGKAPKDMVGSVRIQLTGKDAQGAERSIRITLTIDPSVDAVKEAPVPNQNAQLEGAVIDNVAEKSVPRGRAGLSDQIKMAGKGVVPGERLAKAAAPRARSV